MSDRALLEAAARAAGYAPVRWTMGSEWPEGLLLEGIQQPWNPLTDDGDALRLAVRLQMDICTYVNGASVECGGGPAMCEHSLNALAATRLAIVRAAAAIGNKLEKSDADQA